MRFEEISFYIFHSMIVSVYDIDMHYVLWRPIEQLYYS